MDLDLKVNKTTLEEYKQYADHYVHKKDVDYLYNEILPKVKEIKERKFFVIRLSITRGY